MFTSVLDAFRRISAMFGGRTLPQRWRQDRMRDDMDDYRILWRLDDEPCEVYLFQRWGGYSHPILPGDPLTHVEALHTPSLCRAFVRDLNGEPLMVRFSTFAARDSELPLAAPCSPGVYSVEMTEDGAVSCGEPLARAVAAMSDQVILVPEQAAVGPATMILRRLQWSRTWDYTYDGNGVIERVDLSNGEGNRSFRMRSAR